MAVIRRLIVFLAQIAALPVIVLATCAGALLGERLAPAILSDGTASFVSTIPDFPLYLGAFSGFLVSLLGIAAFYLLVEIARNTKNPFN